MVTCWNIISCVVQIDGESSKGKVIYFPPKKAEAPDSRMSSAGVQRESMLDIQQPGRHDGKFV